MHANITYDPAGEAYIYGFTEHAHGILTCHGWKVLLWSLVKMRILYKPDQLLVDKRKPATYKPLAYWSKNTSPKSIRSPTTSPLMLTRLMIWLRKSSWQPAISDLTLRVHSLFIPGCIELPKTRVSRLYQKASKASVYLFSDVFPNEEFLLPPVWQIQRILG